MQLEIKVPKLSSEMEEGVIVKISKNIQDEVRKEEGIAELVVGKLNYEIISPEAGIVKNIMAKEGEIVPVDKVIAVIEITESQHEIQEQKEIKDTVQNKKILASPKTKKFAREKGIDLALVANLFPDKKLTLKDVEKYIESKDKVKVSPMAEKVAEKLDINISQINKEGRIMRQDVLNHNKKSKFDIIADPTDKRVPMTQMRKAIAQRMSESWSMSPVVNYDIKVDVTNLKKLKNDLKEVQKLTYTDFLVKIAANVLLKFPLVNCSIDGDELIFRNYANIGVAVALENGLVVPVVKYANVKRLKDISSEIKDLAYKAKTNQLTPDEFTGGTFTITNLGMFGIDSFTPIINQPEVAILGINSITETPVFENGSIVGKPLMKLSLTADHRAVDGAIAAQFLYKIKQYIENPGMLVI